MTALALDPALRIALRAALSLLFVCAAGHKLRDIAGFRAALANYDLLPQPTLGVFPVLLIGAELGTAAGLWLPGLGAAAAISAASLLVLYAGAIIINLIRGRRDIDCGCAGAARGQPLSAALVTRNGALATAALASALPMAARPLTWVDGVTIAGGVAALALLYAAVAGLLAYAPRIAGLTQDRTYSPQSGHELAFTHTRWK